jgi:hypothetical protein
MITTRFENARTGSERAAEVIAVTISKLVKAALCAYFETGP